MKKFVANLIRFTSVGAVSASLAVAVAGVASADALTGSTYADAAAYISGTYKSTPVIATVTGDQLDTSDCIVSSWSRSNFSDSSGGRPPNEILLNLNCNAKVAAPGKPGNSLASPAGRTAARDQAAAESISKDPSFCEKDDDTLAYCQRVCKRTGLCEI